MRYEERFHFRLLKIDHFQDRDWRFNHLKLILMIQGFRGDNLFLGVLSMSRDEELAELEGFFDKRDSNQDEIDYLNSLFGEEKRSRLYRRSPLSTRWQ